MEHALIVIVVPVLLLSLNLAPISGRKVGAPTTGRKSLLLRGILFSAKWFNINNSQVFGDSKCIID